MKNKINMRCQSGSLTEERKYVQNSAVEIGY